MLDARVGFERAGGDGGAGGTEAVETPVGFEAFETGGAGSEGTGEC